MIVNIDINQTDVYLNSTIISSNNGKMFGLVVSKQKKQMKLRKIPRTSEWRRSDDFIWGETDAAYTGHLTMDTI